MFEKKVTCDNCKAIYELSYTRTTMRDKDSISCHNCGHLVFRWNEAKIWQAKLVEEGSNKNDNKKL